MAETREAGLRRVLGLVAEGRLTADEAAPILDALSKAGSTAPGSAGRGPAREHHAEHAGHAGHEGPPAPDSGSGSGDRPRFARIEVIENGRRAVDLRVPLGLGRFALSKVPGLSPDQVDEVQDALASGTHGPILDVLDASGDGVRISLE
jgi:hypothetical protein